MNSCLEVFEQGWLQCRNDEFFWKGVLLLRGGPKVSEFQGLCLAELKRCYGPSVKLPYSLQSGWIHNVPLAKSMVLWVLSGRRTLPARLPRGKHQSMATATPTVVVNTHVPIPPAVMTWEDRILNLAWQMLQHALERLPSRGVVTSREGVHVAAVVEEKAIPPPPPPPLQEPLFYPAQMEMAERLFEVLFSGENQDEYEEVDFRILLPPSVSLQKQTEQRLMQVFGGDVGGRKKVLNR